MEAPKASKEDMEDDLRRLYRRQGEIEMKIGDLTKEMDALRNPKGENRYASPQTTVELLNKLQEEMNFHTAKKANTQRLIDGIESKLDRPN